MAKSQYTKKCKDNHDFIPYGRTIFIEEIKYIKPEDIELFLCTNCGYVKSKNVRT